MSARRLILASQSPRRAALLTQMGLVFDILPADIDETVRPDEHPHDYVQRLARHKASHVHQPHSVSLGADTIVLLEDEILGKPRGQTECVAVLLRLSQRTHRVLTGLAAYDGERTESTVVEAQVRFGRITPELAERYWATGEPADKAGSYGIQGIGGIFVEHIIGSYSAVVGLPVPETEALLQRFNIDTWSMRVDGRRAPD